MKSPSPRLTALFAFASTLALSAAPYEDSDIYGKSSWEHADLGYHPPAGLVRGAAFIDRILPMPVSPGDLRADVWGAPHVKPRNVKNGIEDPAWSYWCRSVFKDPGDGKFHLFGARWPENHPKGFDGWSQSRVYHAVSASPTGPFKIVEPDIGHGHNVTTYRAKDGSYVIGIIYGGYIGKSLTGPWTERNIPFDFRGSACPDDSNNTYTSREDGSVLMINQPGRVWISEDGLKPFRRVTDSHGGHPCAPGIFEDPIIWRDEVQYNVIFNDWFGRTAYYLRSKDGVKWVWDQGVAYDVSVAKHPDGSRERWYKYERPSVLTDEFGRATHIYFAVLGTRKDLDKPNDGNTTKNIALPLVVPRRLEILEKKNSSGTATIRVRIKSEPGFSPQSEVKVASLSFGAPSAVDYGKGLKATGSEAAGADLIVTFSGASAGFGTDDYCGKMIGADARGGLLFGFARLPDVSFSDPILDANRPDVRDGRASFVVENFGMAASRAGTAAVAIRKMDGSQVFRTEAPLPAIPAYGNTRVDLPTNLSALAPGDCWTARYTLNGGATPFVHEAVYQRVTDRDSLSVALTLPNAASARETVESASGCFTRGNYIAVRSPSTLTWLLDGSFDKLSLTAGADKTCYGASVVEIWGDGRRLAASSLCRPVSIYNENRRIEVPVKGIRNLTILSNAFFASHPVDRAAANLIYGDPRLTRTAPRANTTEIGRWTPDKVKEAWTTLEWPLPANAAQPAAILFRFTDGNHRLDIREIQITAAGKTLFANHDPKTANQPDSPVAYDLGSLKIPSGAKAVLRATVRTDGGTNSTGTIEIISKKP